MFGFSVYQVLKTITVSGIDPSRNLAVFAAILTVLGLQCVAVIGLYYFSRIAAVGSFVIFLMLVSVAYDVGGFQSRFVSIGVIVMLQIVLLLAFIYGIRGTIAYHRLLKHT